MGYRDVITIDAGRRRGRACIRDLRITVYDVLWRLDPDITERDIVVRPARNAVSVLKISYGGESFTVGPAQEILLRPNDPWLDHMRFAALARSLNP